mgnify:CR=1 FL=1
MSLRLGAIFLALLAGPAWAASPLAVTRVKSKEWLIRRSPQKEEEFKGDVRYWTLSYMMRSDWALFKHDSETWDLKGNVRADYTLPDGAGVLKASGDKARFSQVTRKGELLGPGEEPIRFEMESSDGSREYGQARRLDWEMDSIASLTGAVRIWGTRMESWADRADYDWKTSEMRLTGSRPVVRKLEGEWVGAVQADSIVARDTDPRRQAYAVPEKPGKDWTPPVLPPGQIRRLIAEGRSRGWLVFRKAPGGALP